MVDIKLKVDGTVFVYGVGIYGFSPRHHYDTVKIHITDRNNLNHSPSINFYCRGLSVCNTIYNNTQVGISVKNQTLPSNCNCLDRRDILPAVLIPDPILDDVCKVRLLHPDAGDLFEGAGYVVVSTRQLQHELLRLVGVGDGEVCTVKLEGTCGRGAGCASLRFETQTTVLQFRTGPRSHAQCLG